MRLWVLRTWDELHTTYWFLPTLLAAAAIILAWVTPVLDRFIQSQSAHEARWAYTGSPDGARAVLSTIAGSMITVAGVVFSINIVALSLASAQFGPRLLRSFIRDRRNQFVLGTFTATFIYCLLVLLAVRGKEHEQFVPGISVSLGILFSLIDICLLIYYIHHVTISIQVTQVIATVEQELCEAIDRLWPEELGHEPPNPINLEQLGLPPLMDEQSVAVDASKSGYVDAINDADLIRLAQDRGLIIRLARRPGHFVVNGGPLAMVWPGDKINDDLCQAINKAFILSSQRTPFQDVEYVVERLVEIAVRALSPAINDPFTAMTCIDRLGEALCRLAQRSVPSPYRCDAENRLRIITHPPTFEGVVDAAFNQIRQYGCTSPAILIRMLENLAVVASHTHREDVWMALKRHADLVHRASARGIPEEEDRKDVEVRYIAIRAALTRI
jgi:uncharacterized membrane protein